MTEYLGLSLDSPMALAPLAGISDSAFRRLAREQGAALSCTEMVSAKGLYYKSPGTEELLAIDPSEGPVGIQIFGSEPDMIAFAADKLKDRPNAFLDINMGCPVPKVVKNGEGSAMLLDPDNAARCVEAAVSHGGGKPVTIKMRIGFYGKPGADGSAEAGRYGVQADGSSAYDYVGFAKLMERAGTNEFGTITGLYTVLVEGDDTNEPISDTVRGIVDGHIILSRTMAARNHYPAIDILLSISRLMSDIVDHEEKELASKIRELLAIYYANYDLIMIGAYKPGTNNKLDVAVNKIERINEFLQQKVSESSTRDEVIEMMKQIIS